MRVYDPRIGKFLSIDPLTSDYPFYTPYQYAGNKPVWATDLDGLEENTSSTYLPQKGPLLTAPSAANVLPMPQAAAIKADTRSPELKALARQEAIRAELQAYMYNSSQGASFRLFSGVGAGFAAVAEEAAVGWMICKGVQGFKLASSVLRNAKNARIASLMTTAAKIGEAERFALAGTRGLRQVATGREPAFQELTPAALQALDQVENGATVYRLGTAGVSKTGAKAQFWSFENPLSMSAEAYATKYGIRLENVQNADFIETATIRKDAVYVTRGAPTMPGAPPNAGGGIEVVVEKGGTTGNKITSIKRN